MLAMTSTEFNYYINHLHMFADDNRVEKKLNKNVLQQRISWNEWHCFYYNKINCKDASDESKPKNISRVL